MGLSTNGGAILMSFLAGAATTLGGLLALLLAHKIKPVPFAGALGFAGGVMVFVSFVEIYAEGLAYLTMGFVERKIGAHPEKSATCVAMALFFGGWFLASVLDAMVHFFLEWYTTHGLDQHLVDQEIGSVRSIQSLEPSASQMKSSKSTQSGVSAAAYASAAPPNMKSWISKVWESPILMALTGSEPVDAETQAIINEKFARDCYKVTRLGYFTAFVLALHNLPEGIATFTGGAADHRLGLGLCIAIGIHNIPEGMAVAVPILFGTGSKWKAMLYTIVSGLAEPLGGFLAWGVIGNEPDPTAFGIAFMITCGIMVNVALKELLFAALKYDHGNRITSLSFTLGMLVMATSLVALEWSD